LPGGARSNQPSRKTPPGPWINAEQQEGGGIAAQLDRFGDRHQGQADPAPKPIAVNPAARPRRSGNHFSALPTQVP